MSRVCAITGKGPLSGNNRSHSLRATRRVQRPNLHTYKINVDGKLVSVKMSARGYRMIKKAAAKKVTKPVEKKVETTAEAK